MNCASVSAVIGGMVVQVLAKAANNATDFGQDTLAVLAILLKAAIVPAHSRVAVLAVLTAFGLRTGAT